MAINKWYRLTPDQIRRLNKDTTVVVVPLGTMGSVDESTRLWADYKAVRDDAVMLVNTVNGASDGPLAEFEALSLLPLSFGVAPGPNQPGTIAVPREVYESVVEAICSSLTNSEIRFVVLVARNSDVEAAAEAVAERLNQTRPEPWITVINPLQSPELASAAGDVCRALCRIFGCDPNECPP